MTDDYESKLERVVDASVHKKAKHFAGSRIRRPARQTRHSSSGVQSWPAFVTG